MKDGWVLRDGLPIWTVASVKPNEDDNPVFSFVFECACGKTFPTVEAAEAHIDALSNAERDEHTILWEMRQ